MKNNALKQQLEGHVGMCLKKRQEALELKRSDVGKLIGVKPKLIKAVENGHASLSLYQFHRLLHHLGHNKEGSHPLRCVSYDLFRISPVRDFVLAHGDAHVRNAGHGVNAVGIDFLQLLNPIENRRELAFQRFGRQVAHFYGSFFSCSSAL